MPRWLRYPTDMHRDPAFAALPDDVARMGWWRVLSEAAHQPKPGTFANRALLTEAIPERHAAHIDTYLRDGMLRQGTDPGSRNGDPDGTLHVVGWRRYYMGDSDSPDAQRMRDRRAEQRAERGGEQTPERPPERGGERPPEQHPEPTRARASFSSSSEHVDVNVAPARVEDEDDEGETRVVAWLAREVGYLAPSMQARVGRLVDAIGVDLAIERLEKMKAAGDMPPGDVNGWVFALTDRFRAPLRSLAEREDPTPPTPPYCPPGHKRPWPGSCSRDPWHDGPCRPVVAEAAN